MTAESARPRLLPGSLTAKERAFVEEYLIDLNATQAAIRASYSPRSAEKIGWQLLQKTRVADAIAVAQAERSRRTGISQDRVLNELALIAFARISDVVQWDDQGLRLLPSAQIPADSTAAIASITQVERVMRTADGNETVVVRRQTVKLHDKYKALLKTGEHLGLWQKGTASQNDPMPYKVYRQEDWDQLVKYQGEDE